MANCKFEGCDNEVRHVELGICYTCYSGLRYWRGRSVSAMRARERQIVRLKSRMEYMIVGSPMPKRKRPKLKVVKGERAERAPTVKVVKARARRSR